MLLHGFVSADSIEAFVLGQISIINVYSSNASGNLLSMTFDLREFNFTLLGHGFGGKQVVVLSKRNHGIEQPEKSEPDAPNVLR